MDPARIYERYQSLQRYVGWTADDGRLLRAAGEPMEPHLSPLVEDFYDEIGRHHAARKVITGGAEQIARLKRTLHSWMSELFGGAYGPDYVVRRWNVGLRHVQIGLDQVYTNAALSRMRSGLVAALNRVYAHDATTLARTVAALHKLLDLDLAVIEDAYQAERTSRLASVNRDLRVEVADRRRAETELRLLQELTLSIASMHELSPALEVTLQKICTATGWSFGEVWVPDETGSVLQIAAYWGADDPAYESFIERGQQHRFAPGSGLPGRVWETRQPDWIESIDESNFIRCDEASRAGFCASAAVPILAGSEAIGVMAFFMDRHGRKDERLLKVIAAAAASLGPVIQRRRLEEELAQHRFALEDLVRQRTAELDATHEQLRHADRLASIGTLAAGLGHDMNNVLLPIRARLDALDQAGLPEEAQRQFVAVRRSLEYLQHLSDGLHLLALDPDDAEASDARTNLSEWWSQVGPLLVKAVPKHVAFQCDLSPELPAVAIPPHRLTQAVLNLVVNAGEAVAEDGVVRIWARLDDDCQTVLLGVTDNGVGMTPDVLNHALDPFFTTKKRGLGTGLGLSLVRGVVTSAGGSIDIDSNLGQGSTVTLNIPIAAEAAAGGERGRPPVASVSIRDARAATFVSAMLSASGYDVHRNGEVTADTAIWVVDPETVLPQAAREFASQAHRPQLILFGKPQSRWNGHAVAAVPATCIDDPDDFELIRDAIGRAIRANANVESKT